MSNNQEIVNLSETLQNVQSTMCDMVSVADFQNKLTSTGGFVVNTVLCNIAGDVLFSYDTVMKYSKDVNGIEKITAEVAGNIVESIVMDAGIKQTVLNIVNKKRYAYYITNVEDDKRIAS